MGIALGLNLMVRFLECVCICIAWEFKAPFRRAFCDSQGGVVHRHFAT